MYNAAPNVAVTVNAVKKNQTITFAPQANVFVGDTIVLSAISTSALTEFTYSLVSGSATVSNDTLFVTGDGQITVNAAQAGNFEYNSANVDAVINSSKVDQTITFHFT